MQPTGRLDNHKLLCVDITGIDLSEDEPAMLALVARIATSLRSMRKGKGKVTDNPQPTHSSDSRKLVHIDVTDIDFVKDESESIVNTLFNRLGNALLMMAKEKEASEKLSLEGKTQSSECRVYSDAEQPSKDYDSDDSGGSSPTLGRFSGPWQDPHHFLDSWENTLDAFEGDSEFYEPKDDHSKAHEFDEHASAAAIKAFKDSNPGPEKMYYDHCHNKIRNTKAMKFPAIVVKHTPILEPMQAEICHVGTDGRQRYQPGLDSPLLSFRERISALSPEERRMRLGNSGSRVGV
jgi:hypothetical protein